MRRQGFDWITSRSLRSFPVRLVGIASEQGKLGLNVCRGLLSGNGVIFKLFCGMIDDRDESKELIQVGLACLIEVATRGSSFHQYVYKFCALSLKRNTARPLIGRRYNSIPNISASVL